MKFNNALYEEEADDKPTEVDKSMDNEEEAKELITMWLKMQPKKEGGGTYKKLSAFDENLADRVALLLRYDKKFRPTNPGSTYVTPKKRTGW
jgi:hypothetical protein